MSTITDERLAALLVSYSNDWMRSNPRRAAYPFHLIVLQLVLARDLELIEPLPASEVKRIQEIIADDVKFESVQASEKTLGELANDLSKRYVSPVDGTWPRIETTVCLKKQRNSSGEVVGCCSEAEVTRGCTIEVGTEYMAATNGVAIIYAGFLRDEVSRRAARVFLGTEMPKLLLFTFLHEFGHILHVVPGTLHYYDQAYLFYTRCARLFDPEVRERNRVIVNDVDRKEFFASLFSIASIRALGAD